MCIIDYRQICDLEVGEAAYTLTLSELARNLVCSVLSMLDVQDAWLYDGEPLGDDRWATVIEDLSDVLWQLQTKVTDMGHEYIDRGDPAAWDVSTAAFTKDGAYHSLDLSGIVTDADAVAVHLRIYFRDGSASQEVAFRKDGNSHTYNLLSLATQVANVWANLDGFVELGPGRKVSYYVAPGMDDCYLLVRGWLRPVEV